MRLAADQGHDRALFALASSYGEGKGVPKDLALAFAYFELGLIMSESKRTADAKARLDGMLAQMSDAEIAKAKKIVEDWKPQPTALTIEAQNGILGAKEHLQNAK
ncbi:MAG: hypothetical protein ACKVP5_04155 [Aestuariivirga sp.]